MNGVPILIRGAGWTDDLLLAEDEANLETQMRYVRQMNLNTVRLEGFWGCSQKLYDLADRLGILLMVGWSCHWEWENYLGRVVDGFKERETVSRLDCEECVTLRVKKRAGANIVDIADQIKTLLDEGRDQVLNGLLETALQDRDPTIPIIYATMKLRSEAWDDIRRALSPILSCLDSYESAGGHICHVLGIALYRCGLLEDALDVWKRGLPFEFQGLCGLEAHIDLAEYFQTKGTRDGAGADRPARTSA